MLIYKQKDKENKYRVFSIKLLIIIAFVGLGFFLYSISSFLYLLAFSFFLTLLFSPFLNKMNRFKIPDFLGIIIIYIFLVLFLLVAIFSIIPILLKQSSMFIDFVQNYINNLANLYQTYGIDGLGLPQEIATLAKRYLVNVDLSSVFGILKDNLANISKFIAIHMGDVASIGTNIIVSIGGALVNFLLIFIMSFFIVLERKDIKNFFYNIIPNNISIYLKTRENAIIDSLYEWLKGQMLLGLSIFIIVFISLNVLKIFGIDLENIFTLALIAGLMEFVPYLGPILAVIPALTIAIGLGVNPFFIVLLIYIIIQQVENNFLVPYIMGKTLDLSSFLVLIMMTIGATTAGIVGIIIAIPLSRVLQIFVKDYLHYKNR
ncbi:MAG: AI-2E family transporter [Candidatus Gracilibacteria bacterium]|nr:AI-2E family transporter [Candidatus Gracilibacteria bacterium]